MIGKNWKKFEFQLISFFLADSSGSAREMIGSDAMDQR